MKARPTAVLRAGAAAAVLTLHVFGLAAWLLEPGGVGVGPDGATGRSADRQAPAVAYFWPLPAQRKADAVASVVPAAPSLQPLSEPPDRPPTPAGPFEAAVGAKVMSEVMSEVTHEMPREVTHEMPRELTPEMTRELTPEMTHEMTPVVVPVAGTATTTVPSPGPVTAAPGRDAPPTAAGLPWAEALGGIAARGPADRALAATTLIDASPGPTALAASQALNQAQADRQDCPEVAHPPVLRERGIEGVVHLRVRVSAEGRAAEVQLQQPSGWRLLDAAALAQARGCRFRPARRGALAVESWVEYPVRFSLDG